MYVYTANALILQGPSKADGFAWARERKEDREREMM